MGNQSPSIRVLPLEPPPTSVVQTSERPPPATVVPNVNNTQQTPEPRKRPAVVPENIRSAAQITGDIDTLTLGNANDLPNLVRLHRTSGYPDHFLYAIREDGAAVAVCALNTQTRTIWTVDDATTPLVRWVAGRFINRNLDYEPEARDVWGMDMVQNAPQKLYALNKQAQQWNTASETDGGAQVVGVYAVEPMNGEGLVVRMAADGRLVLFVKDRIVVADLLMHRFVHTKPPELLQWNPDQLAELMHALGQHLRLPQPVQFGW